jgi:MYXO-CTERM domain-containing protein
VRPTTLHAGHPGLSGGRRALALTLWIALGTAPACVDAPPQVWIAAATVDICSGVMDGALCNDQNACTINDRCQAGVCVGIAATDGTPCTDGNQCTTGDVCTLGLCQGAPVLEGNPCTDGEPCTEPDTCTQGQCVPGPAKVCNDGIACTMDECMVGVGCRFLVVGPCPDGGSSDGSRDSTPDGDAATTSDGSDSGMTDGQDGMAGQDADAAPDVDAVSDAEAGAAPDADARMDGGSDLVSPGPDSRDAGGDADAGTGSDGADAQIGGSDTQPPDAADAPGVDGSARLFDARGGACVCAIGSAPSSSDVLWSLLVVVLLLRFRPRRR